MMQNAGVQLQLKGHKKREDISFFRATPYN